MKKFKKRRAVQGNANVMIVTPCPLNQSVDVRNATFCASAIARGIAAWMPTPSRAGEDGRNQIFRETLAMMDGRYTHFFLLDADSWPYNPYMIEKLLSHDKKVIAGPTPVQREGANRGDLLRRLWNIVIEVKGIKKSLKRSDDPAKDELPKGLFKTKYVGSTGMLVAREVIEKMPIPYQKTQRNAHGQTVLSEDYYFCEQIQKMGYDIWIDPTLKSGHNNSIDIGNY